MVDVVQATLFYMNPDAPIPVHSPYSALPYEVKVSLCLSMIVLLLTSKGVPDFYMNVPLISHLPERDDDCSGLVLVV